jgi:hypothetical protein
LLEHGPYRYRALSQQRGSRVFGEPTIDMSDRRRSKAGEGPLDGRVTRLAA